MEGTVSLDPCIASGTDASLHTFTGESIALDSGQTNTSQDRRTLSKEASDGFFPDGAVSTKANKESEIPDNPVIVPHVSSKNLDAEAILRKSSQTQNGTAMSPVCHLIVVGFHHQFGNHMEFIYPDLKEQPHLLKEEKEISARIPGCPPLPPQWRHLPFVAVPDGVHNLEHDTVYFTVPSLEEPPVTLHGVACFRQVERKDVQAVTPDMTRNHVQKSVVVLSRLPLYGAIRARVQPVTQLYFQQGDFSRTGIMREVYDNLNATLSPNPADSAKLYVGLSLQDLIRRFGVKTLVLFKAVLLERRVLMYGLPVNLLCSTLLSIVSLFPALLQRMISLTPGAEASVLQPELTKADFGLPLDVFHGGVCEGEANLDPSHRPQREGRTACILQPYLSLEQVDLLQESNVSGFLAATSNMLCVLRPHPKLDLLVHVHDGKVDVRNDQLGKKALALTQADRRFMDRIIRVVDSTAGPATSAPDPNGIQEETTAWVGSDGWIRREFEVYLETFLASIAALAPHYSNPHPHPSASTSSPGPSSPAALPAQPLLQPAASVKPPQRGASPTPGAPMGWWSDPAVDMRHVADYGTDFARAWLATPNAAKWRSSFNPAIAALRPTPPAGSEGPGLLTSAAAAVRTRMNVQGLLSMFRDTDSDSDFSAERAAVPASLNASRGAPELASTASAPHASPSTRELQPSDASVPSPPSPIVKPQHTASSASDLRTGVAAAPAAAGAILAVAAGSGSNLLDRVRSGDAFRMLVGSSAPRRPSASADTEVITSSLEPASPPDHTAPLSSPTLAAPAPSPSPPASSLRGWPSSMFSSVRRGFMDLIAQDEPAVSQPATQPFHPQPSLPPTATPAVPAPTPKSAAPPPAKLPAAPVPTRLMSTKAAIGATATSAVVRTGSSGALLRSWSGRGRARESPVDYDAPTEMFISAVDVHANHAPPAPVLPAPYLTAPRTPHYRTAKLTAGASAAQAPSSDNDNEWEDVPRTGSVDTVSAL